MREAIKRNGEDKAEKKEEEGGLFRNLFIALLPFVYFDLSSGEGWRAYNDHVTGKLGGRLTWVPFIIILAVAHAHVGVAIWAAFGVQSFVVFIFFLRGTYDEKYPLIMQLETGMWLSYLGLGIAYAIKPFPYPLISPITTTALFATSLFSLLICRPFTAQLGRAKVSAEIARSEEFNKMMYIVTIFWTTIFLLMAALSWAAFALYDVGAAETSKEPGQLWMGTIIPIALPFLGKISMPYLMNFLKARAGMDTQANTVTTQGPALEEADVINR
eukprot:gb/GEZN01011196.1/.p1 GENE.gb/GEZN01011196.1/~~gb/GEZN01011196.1/.p1  ORF type:complete len:272 (+),score=36.21 gb/GEZN01011196.1/:43-858(+)